MRALLWYLHRTRSIRGSEIGLFISSKRPHKRVAKSTLSSWLVDVIIKADAISDSTSPRAHSVRAISSSSAAAKGISISDIIVKTVNGHIVWCENSLVTIIGINPYYQLK